MNTATEQSLSFEHSQLRITLVVYLLFTTLSFFFLVTPTHAAIGVPIYTFCQFLYFLYVFKWKTPFLLFIPLFILSLNFYISANTLWHFSNFIVSLLLYWVMILCLTDDFPIKENSLAFLHKIVGCIVRPLRYLFFWRKWILKKEQGKSAVAKRLFFAALITAPVVLLLLTLLVFADLIFQEMFILFLEHFFRFDFLLIFRILLSCAVALYFFGLLFSAFVPTVRRAVPKSKPKNGDMLILNILLVSILFIYTIFVVIQFRYLFAGATLPYGLTYATYARRGFFELLFLSGVNVLIILITTWLTKTKVAKLTRFLSLYLCAVTLILLVSSYYRMSLYNGAYGLTRLRFLVCGFLIFEAFGLLFTFFYIIKPTFNIVALYLGIGLTYYLVLNLVPMDYFIAKQNVDMYFAGSYADTYYFYNLSADAAPQIARIIEAEPAHHLSENRYWWLSKSINAKLLMPSLAMVKPACRLYADKAWWIEQNTANEKPSWASKNLSYAIASRYLSE